MATRGEGNGGQGMNWCRKDLRLGVYLRDGMACLWCGSGLEDGVMLTLDHLTPRSEGGGNGATNLVTACRKCNSSRADRPVDEFAAAAAGYLNHGVTGAEIADAVREHAARPIRPYRDEAKAILARRPSWQDALSAAQGRAE